MSMKSHILAGLQEQLDQWDVWLGHLTEAQATQPHFEHDWSIKDVIIHLWAWQQISIARMEAGAESREPVYPDWLAATGWHTESDVDITNAKMVEVLRAKSWPEVQAAWRDGYQKLIDTSATISEWDLLDWDGADWLDGFTLASVVLNSYHHHLEHIDDLKRVLGGVGRS